MQSVRQRQRTDGVNMSLGAVRRRSGGESNGSLFNKVKPAILGASPSSFSRVFITNALCTLVLECDVAPHPPPPVEAWWGGLLRTPPNLLGPLPKHQSHLLRQRCDARGFGPLLIEIIAERKVALTFERTVRARPGPHTRCKFLFCDPIIQWRKSSARCHPIASNGRIARVQGSPRERPESVRKPPFHC